MEFKSFNNSDWAVCQPRFGSEFAMAFDLRANEDLLLQPGERRAVATGVTFSTSNMNVGIRVLPRSGLALNHGVTVLNAPGIIDPDYQGKEIKVILVNQGAVPFSVVKGERIAQAEVYQKSSVHILGVARTGETRGGGFGSTGVK